MSCYLENMESNRFRVLMLLLSFLGKVRGMWNGFIIFNRVMWVLFHQKRRVDLLPEVALFNLFIDDNFLIDFPLCGR